MQQSILAFRDTQAPDTMAGRARRMTLPSIHGRTDPIHKAATKPTSDPAHGAAFIFLHGLGDDAQGLESKDAGRL
jgi:hypothetical protein